MKPYSLKEVFQGARGLVTRKTLAIAGVPLLLLAVAVALLTLFRLALDVGSPFSNDEQVLAAACEAFPNAVLTQLEEYDLQASVFKAAHFTEHAGYFVAVSVRNVLDQAPFFAVAVDAEGEVFYEQAFLPEDEGMDAARQSALEIALELAGAPPGN